MMMAHSAKPPTMPQIAIKTMEVVSLERLSAMSFQPKHPGSQEVLP
jgi:hypothetical protein